jgi:alpha-galactosidase
MMVDRRGFLFLIVSALAVSVLLGSPAAGQAADGKVKVFIYAGQSNAVGMAKNTLWNTQAEAPETKDFFAHFRKDGKWIVRDDVFIKFHDNKGGLTIGFGAPKCSSSELEFGWMMGDNFDEPVLIIKTAWGGRSLYKPFRSPSSGLPGEDKLQAELEQAQKKVKAANEKSKKNAPLPTMDDIKQGYGQCYRDMMTEVKDTLANYETLFPELKGKQFELAGFVWFQGWNDMFGGIENEYAANMKNFINDVRKDLGVPKLPLVIAAMGQNGSNEPKGAMKVIQDAQMSMQDLPEFKGNVKSFRTDVLVDKKAEQVIKGWRDHVEEWNKVGSDEGYHYLGSAIWYTRIGHAMGEAMLDLLKNQGK